MRNENYKLDKLQRHSVRNTGTLQFSKCKNYILRIYTWKCIFHNVISMNLFFQNIFLLFLTTANLALYKPSPIAQNYYIQTDESESVKLPSHVWFFDASWTVCSLPGSSGHRIFHPRILEWVVIIFPRKSSWPRDRTWVSCITGEFFTVWANREALKTVN